VVVAASFGVSSTEQGSFNYKALFDLADQAAYQVKAEGGNTVHCIKL
jgi:two-component system cell cycle response regulator